MKKYFLKLFHFYINSSIHVALAVIALVIITYLQFNIAWNWTLLLYVFLGTITGYNFVKYAPVAGLHYRSLTKRLRVIQVFSLFCFIGLLISALFLSRYVLWWSLGFGVLTLFYAIPLTGASRNLRSVSGIKIFIIALVWAGVTVIIPLVPIGADLVSNAGLVFLARFLLVIVWILPFEIRDLKYDHLKLGTLPQQLGIYKTKVFGSILLTAIWLLEILLLHDHIAYLIATTIMVLLTAVMLWKTTEEQSRYFTAFWIEGIPILWLFLLWFFKLL